MEHIETVIIQYLDPLDTYTAHIRKNGEGWIGWIPEFPEVQSEESTREELLDTLEKDLHAVLTSDSEAWRKQVEEDMNAGKLNHLLDEVDEDIRTGKCKDL